VCDISEESIEKIVAAGAVPRLIELMASGDIEVKRNSTGALANVSSLDSTCFPFSQSLPV
jgi:hypothetical protein